MHETSTQPTAPVQPAYLEISGQVHAPRTLAGADLTALPRVRHVETFVRKDGAPVIRHWCGIRLLDVLALAQPLEGARYVRVCAGSYQLPLALTTAGAALLCDEVDGRLLQQQQGGPWRLFVPGSHAHTSVKWVDRLELTAERGSYDAGCGRSA